MPASSIFSNYHIRGFSSSCLEDWEEEIFHSAFDLSYILPNVNYLCGKEMDNA